MAEKYEVTEKDIYEILEEVRNDLGVLTKSKSAEGEVLAKAEDKEPKEEKKEAAPEEKAHSAVVDGDASKPAPHAESDDVAPPAVAADPVDESAMAAPDAVSPEASADGMAPEMGGEEGMPSLEELCDAYGMLPDAELALHVAAAKAALHARTEGEEEEMPMDMGGMPEAPAAAPEAAMGKAEMPHNPELKPKLGKSAPSLEVEALKAEIAAMKAEQDKALTSLMELATIPMRKSIKNISEIDFLSRPGESKKTDEVDVSKLSRKEVITKLTEQAKGELKKSDRDLINQYAYGNISVEGVKHLLK